MKRKVFLAICMLSVAMLTACGGGETTPIEEVQEEAVVEVTEETTEEEEPAEEEPVVEEEPVEEEPAVEPAYAVTDEIAITADAAYSGLAYEGTVDVKKINDFTVETIMDSKIFVTSDGYKLSYFLNGYYDGDTDGSMVENVALKNADGDEVYYQYFNYNGLSSEQMISKPLNIKDDDGIDVYLVIKITSPNVDENYLQEPINPEDWVELTRDCYFVISE